ALQSRTHWIGADADAAARLAAISPQAAAGRLIVLEDASALLRAGAAGAERLEELLAAGACAVAGAPDPDPSQELSALLSDPSVLIALRVHVTRRTAPVPEGAPS